MFSIDEYNEACNDISAIYLKVGDESMSEISFRTTPKGDLTNLSYISEIQNHFQYCSLLCYWGIAINWDTYVEVMDK